MSMGSGEKLPKWLDNVSGIAAFSLASKTISDDITLDFGDKPVSGFNLSKITISKSGTVVEIKCGDLTFADSALNSQSKTTNGWTLKLSCSNNPTPSSEFARSSSVARIIGKPLLVTSGMGTGNYRYFNGTSIVEVYFVPNRITATGVVTTGVLIDASVVSLANALKEGLGTQQTLTISNATTKAKLDTIVGSVSEVVDGETTYHIFEQDVSGSVTLRNFVENTKGWVIA